MYDSKLSDGRLKLYAALSAAGAAALLIGIVLYMTNGADGLGTIVLSTTFLLTLLSSLFVLIGVIVLISQRVRKLNRMLSKRQLVTGFGFAVFGALIAGICTLIAVSVDVILHYETGICFAAQCVMCAGGWLCFAFGLPIWKSFKKQ
ncbi:MAG: hypothetical protein IJH07_04830 [Ruminococcus sp.]|nr:hypothetical protein [Ruminococcus sp.]